MDTGLVTKEKGRCVEYGYGGQPYGWLMTGGVQPCGRGCCWISVASLCQPGG